MTVNVIPYGKLADGSYNLALNSSGVPTASAIEIKDTLPTTGDTNNFVGRTVFNKADNIVYTFTDDPSNQWVSMRDLAVTVAAPAPSASEPEGTLYYSTDTEVLYLRVSTLWVAIAGKLGAGVIWRHYTGNAVTSLFATGSTQMPGVDYVQVFIDGEALRPGSVGVRDYYMIGNDVQLNATPANDALISIRTLIYQNFGRNSEFYCTRTAANGSLNLFDTGAQLTKPGQLFVALNGVLQVPDTGLGNGTYDYKVEQQDNSIVSITSTGVTATVTTTVAHQYEAGDPVVIYGANQAEYNGSFTVLNVINPTSFRYTMGSDPAVDTATGTMKYAPLKQNDKVVFYNDAGVATPPVTGLIVHIQAIESIIA